MREIPLMDCIRREPRLIREALERREETFASLARRMDGDWGKPGELIFVGSGTSYTASVTAQPLAQKASGLRVTALIPSDVLTGADVLPANALYLFVSQTGTSKETRQALQACQERGLHCAVVSESAQTPMAAAADVWIDMGCGNEEYPMRTIGYSLTVLTLTLTALEIGKCAGHLSPEDEQRWLEDARQAADAMGSLIGGATAWMAENRRKMLRSDCIAFTGAGALYGVALEAAVKTWEMPQIPSMGYELEEGMHGPNFGYDHRHCVIVLSDGEADAAKAAALSRYTKTELGNGFMLGPTPVNDEDFAFAPRGGEFRCLEFAVIVQTLVYELAVAQGRNLLIPDLHERMYSYFNSHDA